MVDIPDMLYQYQDVPAIPWDGEDFANPETAPMPQLDEAIEIIGNIVRHFDDSNRILPMAGRTLPYDIGLARQWLAAHTNDKSSDLPW